MQGEKQLWYHGCKKTKNLFFYSPRWWVLLVLEGLLGVGFFVR